MTWSTSQTSSWQQLHSARGLTDCPLRPQTPIADEQIASCHHKRKDVSTAIPGSAEAPYRTPKAPKLTGVRLDLSDCEGESSSHRARSRKQNISSEPARKSLHQEPAKSQIKEPKLCLGEARQSAPHFSSMLPVLQKQSRIYTLTAVSRQFSLVCLLPNFRNGSTYHPEATQAIHGSQGGQSSNPELNRQICSRLILYHCLTSS